MKKKIVKWTSSIMVIVGAVAVSTSICLGFFLDRTASLAAYSDAIFKWKCIIFGLGVALILGSWVIDKEGWRPDKKEKAE